jgi:hypothetical protein
MRFVCLVFVVACAERQPVFVATVDPPPPSIHVSTTPHHAMPQLTCGEAALARAELVARGKGANHPDVKSVDARLAGCQDPKPSADECLVVTREHVELEARGYGPQHPDMIASDAKRALCP